MCDKGCDSFSLMVRKIFPKSLSGLEFLHRSIYVIPNVGSSCVLITDIESFSGPGALIMSVKRIKGCG